MPSLFRYVVGESTHYCGCSRRPGMIDVTHHRNDTNNTIAYLEQC